MGIDHNELTHRFAYHPPRDDAAVAAHETVRAKAFELARQLDELLPADRPREKALVQTHIEEAMMWANAAIARSETGVRSG